MGGGGVVFIRVLLLSRPQTMSAVYGHPPVVGILAVCCYCFGALLVISVSAAGVIFPWSNRIGCPRALLRRSYSKN